jgi:hypothetical protein
MSKSGDTRNTQITVALIGCLGSIVVAIIGGIFLLISTGVQNSPTSIQPSVAITAVPPVAQTTQYATPPTAPVQQIIATNTPTSHAAIVATSSILPTSPSFSTVAGNAVNLSGQVANDIPGTPLDFGTPVVSAIDTDTKKRDVYAVSLAAGQTLRIVVESSDAINVQVAKPGTKSFNDIWGDELCRYETSCIATFLAAVAGTYYLNISTESSGVGYTLTVSVE